VQIRQTSKQVVVQRCALTSDRKPAPRPSAPAHPSQSQYLWTLKMGAPRIRLQDRSRTCGSQDTRAPVIQCANFGTLLRRTPRKTTLEAMNHEQNLKASFLVAEPPAIALCATKTQGRAPVEQLSPPKSRDILCTLSAPLPNAIASRLSESGHFLAISRANRGGTCALDNACAGGLALWRMTSLELPLGRPALEAGPNSAFLR
jgi:hypothetical protein